MIKMLLSWEKRILVKKINKIMKNLLLLLIKKILIQNSQVTLKIRKIKMEKPM